MFLIVAMLIAATSNAATFDDLQDDVGELSEILQQDRGEEESEVLERQRETGPDLFPEIPFEEEIDRTGDAENSPFVTFLFNGYPVLLKDVPRDVWFAPYVRDVASRGIVSGYRNQYGLPTGEFGPANNVTIEEVAKIAIEAAGIHEETCKKDLLNVSASGSWSRPYIACTEQRGFSIFNDGSVNVKRPALRSEVVVTVLQAFGKLPDDVMNPLVFKDVSSSSQFAGFIQTAKREGLISGYSDSNGNLTGYFGPSDSVKRAEIAKIVSIALQLFLED